QQQADIGAEGRTRTPSGPSTSGPDVPTNEPTAVAVSAEGTRSVSHAHPSSTADAPSSHAGRGMPAPRERPEMGASSEGVSGPARLPAVPVASGTFPGISPRSPSGGSPDHSPDDAVDGEHF